MSGLPGDWPGTGAAYHEAEWLRGQLADRDAMIAARDESIAALRAACDGRGQALAEVAGIISGLRAQVARLQAELDTVLERDVELCLDRDAAQVMGASGGMPDGLIVRATDTGREWVLSGGAWRLAQ